MNRLDTVLMNNPARWAIQRRVTAPLWRSMGADLRGARVLEPGCGCGVGAEVLVDVLGAESVRAFDVDAAIVASARERLDRRADRGRFTVAVGDVLDDWRIDGARPAVAAEALSRFIRTQDGTLYSWGALEAMKSCVPGATEGRYALFESALGGRDVAELLAESGFTMARGASLIARALRGARRP
jgi:hypothetical protein